MNLRDKQILQNISKNVNRKRWQCLHKDCCEFAINSHFYQSTEILKHIAVNGHVYQLESSDLFKSKEQKFMLRKRSVNHAFSLPIYCNQHDDSLFSSIEKTEKVDYNSYWIQSLLSLRSCTSELRRKQIALEKFKRVVSSSMFSNKDMVNFYMDLMPYIELGIKDLEFYINELIFEIESKGIKNNFIYNVYSFKKVGINVSGLFSPVDYNNGIAYMNPENVMENILVNIFPINGFTIVILGYHKMLNNNIIRRYVSDWDDGNFSKKLTRLITTKINSWCISPQIFDRLDPRVKLKFVDYWNKNSMNLSFDQSVDFDLFT